MITRGHIIAAALEHLGMSSLEESPNSAMVDASIWLEDDCVRQKKLMDISFDIVSKYVDIATEFEPAHTPNNMKGVTYSYACETLA